MFYIDENDLTIRNDEKLSFEHDVQPYIDDLKEDIKNDVEHYLKDIEFGCFSDEDIKKMKKFLDYEFTFEDKKYILKKILKYFEYEQKIHGVICFDDLDCITTIMSHWIEQKFGFGY